MRFKYVELQNFLSYGKKQRLSLDHRGLVAVLGFNKDSAGAESNGAGKSTLLEAIVWALYGKTLRKYRGDDVINRSVGKRCEVSLCLEDDGVEYIVYRARKMPGKPADPLILYVGGEPVEGGRKDYTQEAITTLVGMDFLTFCQSVMMWHGSKAFSEMSDADQKGVLEDILNVSQLSKARDAVSKKIRTKQSQLLEIQTEIKNFEDRSYEQRQLIRNYKTRQVSHEELLKGRKLSLLRRKVEIEERIEETHKSSGLDKLLIMREDLEEKDAELNLRQRNVQTERTKISRKFSNKRQQLARAEGAAQSRLQQIKQDLHTFSELAGHSCPTCRQVFSPELASTCMEKWETEAKALRQDILVKSAKDFSNLDVEEQAQLAAVQLDENKISIERESLRGQLRLCADKIKKREAALSLICELEQASFNVLQEIQALDTEIDPYEALILEATGLRDKFDRLLRTHEYKKKSLELEISHLVYWQHAFSNQGAQWGFVLRYSNRGRVRSFGRHS